MAARNPFDGFVVTRVRTAFIVGTESSLSLTLIRHGEVTLPHKDLLYGAHDVNLSPAALMQMPSIAAALAKRQPQLVMTSTLKRCAALARAVADLSGAKLMRDARLRERVLGTWLLKRRSEMEGNPDYHRWAAGDPDVHPEGGESLRMVQARSMAAVMPVLGGSGANGPYQPLPHVEEIYRRALAVGGASSTELSGDELKRVVWVSHGGVIRSWRCFVSGVDLADSLKFAVSYFGCMEYERGPDGVWREVKGEYQIV